MFTVEQINAAHDKVKSGVDFPAYIQEIRQMGVTAFQTWVSDSHTIYYGKNQYQTSSQSMYAPLTIAGTANKELFAQRLRIHQKGQTDYPTFCNDCAATGVEKWFVCLDAMTCTYYDNVGNEVMVEAIPG